MYMMLTFLVRPGDTQYRALPAFSLVSIIPMSIIIASIVKRFHFDKNWIALLLIILFLSNKNSINDIQADYYSGKLKDYKSKMEARQLILTQHNNDSNCLNVITLDKIDDLPKSVNQYIFIKPNRVGNWNGAFEDYYNIDEVRFEGDTINHILKRVNEISLEY